MTPVDSESTSSAFIKPLRLIIICWGYSIHAQRRISIFAEDARFRVIVVSNYDYLVPNTETILLTLPRLDRRWPRLKRFSKFLERVGLWILPDYQIMKNAADKFLPEVILLQTLMYPCFMANWLPRKIPQVVTFWNGDVTWWAKRHSLDLLAKKWLVTRGAQRAAALTVNSETAGRACLQYGVKPERVFLIGYPGVDRNIFFPHEHSLVRQQLGLPQSNPLILWPRGLGGYLNSELFLEALAILAKDVPEIRAVIITSVGGSEKEKSHKLLARKLNIEKNIFWVPKVKHFEMALYHACADVMVSLSSKDSRPNVMLEAMACGTPVVMTDLPQIREWVMDGENGYLIDPKNPSQVAKRIRYLLDPKNSATVKQVTERAIQTIISRADENKVRQQITHLIIDTASGIQD